jgi:DNA polymerase-3 subunit epsilon
MDTAAGWPGEELMGFDLETTGVDRFADVPVSYALVTVRRGEVVRTDTALIDPGREIPAEATAVHGITSERARREGVRLADAVDHMAEVLFAAGRRGVPVVGMKLDFDLTILDVLCRRASGNGLAERGWTGPVLDDSLLDRRFDGTRPGPRTLGDLCVHYGVDIVQAHDAAADAGAAVGVVLALCQAFPELEDITPSVLHRAQVGWYHEWARCRDLWRRDQWLPPLDPREFLWPIAPAAAA